MYPTTIIIKHITGTTNCQAKGSLDLLIATSPPIPDLAPGECPLPRPSRALPWSASQGQGTGVQSSSLSHPFSARRTLLAETARKHVESRISSREQTAPLKSKSTFQSRYNFIPKHVSEGRLWGPLTSSLSLQRRRPREVVSLDVGGILAVFLQLVPSHWLIKTLRNLAQEY